MANVGRKYSFRHGGIVTQEAKENLVLSRLATYHLLADEVGNILPAWNERARLYGELHKSRADPCDTRALWSELKPLYAGYPTRGAFILSLECLSRFEWASPQFVLLNNNFTYMGPTYTDLAGPEAMKRATEHEQAVVGRTLDERRAFYERMEQDEELSKLFNSVREECARIGSDSKLKRRHEEFAKRIKQCAMGLEYSWTPSDYLRVLNVLIDVVQNSGVQLRDDTMSSIGAKQQDKGTLLTDSFERYIALYYLRHTVNIKPRHLEAPMQKFAQGGDISPIWQNTLKEANEAVRPILLANAKYRHPQGFSPIPLSLMDPERIVRAWDAFFEAAELEE